MITDNQRMVMLDNYVRDLLDSDRCNKYYENIEKLWEASGLTNKDLIEEMMSDRENAAYDFKASIFWDMIWLLKEEILVNDALRSLFNDIYSKRFPKVNKYIEDIEQKILNGKKVRIGDSDFSKFYKPNYYEESTYFFFRIYASDLIVSNDCIDLKFFDRQYEFVQTHNFETEADVSDNLVKFTDGSNEEVFKSSLYVRFVQKQKQALADYLKVDVNKLAEHYDKVMTIEELMDGDAIAFDESTLGLIPSSLIEMIWLHGGSSYWLINIQSLNRKNKLGYRYRPNFDKLFEKYCRSSIRLSYLRFTRKGEAFTPLTLARQCAFTEMEALAVSMGYMYMADCLYQIYKQMQKQYYENFSWESFHNRDMKTRYENVINDLKSALSLRDHQLQNLQRLYTSLKESLEKKNELALIKELHEKEKLFRVADEKDIEIERLKSIIASQNHLIEQLQIMPAEPSKESAAVRFDTNADNCIYQYRYLFVGDICALGLEELRRKFPASVFMETNTTNISQIQVDAVVYLVQGMGHSMYFKCKNTPALQNTKTIYFNGRRNIALLFEAMEHEMSQSGYVYQGEQHLN